MVKLPVPSDVDWTVELKAALSPMLAGERMPNLKAAAKAIRNGADLTAVSRRIADLMDPSLRISSEWKLCVKKRGVTGRPKGSKKRNEKGNQRPDDHKIYKIIYEEWLKTDPLYKRQDKIGRYFLAARADGDKTRSVTRALTRVQGILDKQGHTLGIETLESIWKDGRRADRGDGE
jgi:hypothetical protein